MSGVSLGLLVFFLAIRHRPVAAPAAPAMREARGDESWFEKYHPTPNASPVAPHVEARPLAAVTPPSLTTPRPQELAYQQPHSAATMSEQARERVELYHRALASDIGIKPDNGPTLETPRLLGTQTASSSSAPISVAAQPAPPHTIGAWSWIYGTLETGVDSDHPGDVLGRVSQDVKDSVTQTEVLIPMGSILHGYQQGRDPVQPNDQSLLVAWNDIEFPNGGHIQLPNMPGANSEGYPGFQNLVDNHYVRTWTPAGCSFPRSPPAPCSRVIRPTAASMATAPSNRR